MTNVSLVVLIVLNLGCLLEPPEGTFTGPFAQVLLQRNYIRIAGMGPGISCSKISPGDTNGAAKITNQC